MSRLEGMAMVVVLAICAGWYGQREPRLDARSMYDLEHSTRRMEQELALSAADAAELEGVLDLLIGDATRELLAQAESSKEPAAAAARMKIEAQILAPVDGLSYDQLLAAAADRRQHQRVASLLVSRP